MSNATEPDKQTCLTNVGCTPVLVILGIIAVCGIILNLTCLIIFVLDKRLKRPIYIGIPLLALPDMLFLMAKLVYILAGEYLNEMFILKQTVNTVIISAYFSSATHVVLLSLQQYIFLAYPLKSNVWFRNIKVIMVSALTWTICISLGVVYVYVVVVNQDTNKSLASIFNIVMTFLITLIPVGFLTMLHFLKRNVLTNALVHRPNKTVRKMARVVRLVIAGYLLTTTPVNIKDIIEVSVGFLNETWFVLLYQISTVLLYLNYTVNPFIYFFSTPQFRRTIVATFCKKPTVRSGSYNTSGVITNTSFVSK